jgi:transposase
VLSGRATTTAKTGDGPVEMLRMFKLARASAVKARTQAINAMRAVLVTAPDDLRAQLKGLRLGVLIATAARLRPGPEESTLNTAKLSLRLFARRCQHLNDEIADLDAHLESLVTRAGPALTALFGVGIQSAGQLLVTAGGNPDRLRSEASFSMLCGTSPLPASTGKTTGRHRLNRGGDRQANAALHRIVVVRMHWHQPTRDYVERRTKEGMSKREIIRCLKRYIAREIYHALTEPPPATPAAIAA